MVNILEYELKFENKDQLLVAFGKTNPQAKRPCMSSLTFFCRVSLAEYLYTQPCFCCCFQVIPSGLVLFQMVGNLSGRMTMGSDTLWIASHVYHALSFYFRCLNSEYLYFYV
jgi:hypothetical protein